MTVNDVANGQLSVETGFELLANPHRRVILLHLSGGDGSSATLADLAAELHAQLDDVESTEQAQIGLVHHHLPKLADFGLIEYDRQREHVRYHVDDRIELLLEYLEY
ncbi:ArsR/SmtB family transcription factor [Haladaptatus sp. DFWS20]|uniref:ArsR/SmtB family transcription factor n=1 Tax=Haladaptatus sp. DFWS20 TaxID=3403467 RepID=UPI003EB7AABE